MTLPNQHRFAHPIRNQRPVSFRVVLEQRLEHFLQLPTGEFRHLQLFTV